MYPRPVARLHLCQREDYDLDITWSPNEGTCFGGQPWGDERLGNLLGGDPFSFEHLLKEAIASDLAVAASETEAQAILDEIAALRWSQSGAMSSRAAWVFAIPRPWHSDTSWEVLRFPDLLKRPDTPAWLLDFVEREGTYMERSIVAAHSNSHPAVLSRIASRFPSAPSAQSQYKQFELFWIAERLKENPNTPAAARDRATRFISVQAAYWLESVLAHPDEKDVEVLFRKLCFSVPSMKWHMSQHPHCPPRLLRELSFDSDIEVRTAARTRLEELQGAGL